MVENITEDFYFKGVKEKWPKCTEEGGDYIEK